MKTDTSCHSTAPAPVSAEAPIILVGNPNVGKSVIFGALTGRYVTVSNYPGTTVELTHGKLPDGTPLIDTPGTNTLTARSDDERVTADVLLETSARVRAVVQVADAKNLSRALLLTRQLADLQVPLVLVLNMLDEAAAHGVHIDIPALSAQLGIPVIGTIATRGEGIVQLSAAITHAAVPHMPPYDPALENALTQIGALLPANVNSRALAIRLLNGDSALANRFSLNGSLSRVVFQVQEQAQRPPRAELLHQQMGQTQTLLAQVMRVAPPHQSPWARLLSRWMIHPLWGWLIVGLVLWLVYKFVGEFGAGTLVGFMEEVVFGEWINPAATALVTALIPIAVVQDLLVGEYGVITMALSYGIALVLPIVTTFFIAFSILEDSGYLPRLAVMFNRAFKLMGLNGKAVLPMVLGLGCDTMATMSTRILETRKERLLVTLLLALGVPCSAQLGVILGMLSQISALGVLLWSGIIVLTMIAVGLIAAKLLPGERSDFILELPPLRLPRLKNILIKTAARLEWYLKEVLPLFIVGTLILFVLDATGILRVIEQVASPLVVGFLGLPAAATGAFLIGFLRRDYGAAGLFALMLAGELDATQTLVSLVVITLFIPCIANVLMIVREFGGRVALGVALTVFPLAFAVGGLLNLVLRGLSLVP